MRTEAGSGVITITLTNAEARERSKQEMAARKQAERMRRVDAQSDYSDYFVSICERRRRGTWRANKPKGVKG